MDSAESFASWSPHELSGIPKAMQINLEVGLYLARGWITPVKRIGDRTPDDGGVVSGPPWHLEGRSVVTAWSGASRRCARTSAASSTGTTPTNHGSAHCTVRGLRQTASCSKVLRPAISPRLSSIPPHG